MSNYSHQIIESNDSIIVVLVKDGQIFTTTAEANPDNIDTIVDRARARDYEGLEALFTLEDRVRIAYEPLSERVSVRDGRVLFDNDPVDEVIERGILRSLKEGLEDHKPLVNFMEKVYTNTNEHTRESLFRWLNTEDFTIDADGDIVGYKGLRSDYTSVHAGPGIVNGESFEQANLDNSPGNVVEMPRSEVTHDPAVGCARGLHVGSWDYASSFGNGVTVEVRVNPRDVVSVPTDCNDQKMRVAKYRVVGDAGYKHETVVRSADESDTICDWCD